jgi:hypothetical protein
MKHEDKNEEKKVEKEEKEEKKPEKTRKEEKEEAIKAYQEGGTPPPPNMPFGSMNPPPEKK